MSVVYLARRDDSPRLVAIKVVRSGADSAEVLRRFEEESSVLEILDPEYTARIHEASSTEDGSPYFVMEYVDGAPITSFCDGRRLNCRERLLLFAKVCEAVHSAHQKGVIHRDLKPSNVLVTEVGGRAKPKVIDFGLAKLLPRAGWTRADLSLPDQILGTPGYMSPELAAPRTGPPDVRSDVYSLGAILYELLAGEPPHDLDILSREGIEAMLRHIRESEPMRPSRRAALLPAGSDAPGLRREIDPRALARHLQGELDWIVLKALEKEPLRRYGSVQELEADVERLLEHQPIVAAPPSSLYRSRKFIRRHRFGVAAGVAGLVGLLVFAGAMAVQARRIGRERNRAERVSQFMTDLFSVSDPNEARGKTVTAREILDRGAERIASELSGEPEVQAQLMHTVGVVYTNQGLYAKAEQFLARSVGLRKRTLGANHPDTLASMYKLAILYQLQNRLAEAETLHREVLEGQRRVLGEDHRDTLWSITSLATALNTQGRFREAEGLYHEALEKQRRVLGEDDPATVASMNNLGNAVSAQGRLEEAESLFREALERQTRTLGEDHPHTLMSMNNVADACRDRGDYDEAERLHRKVLERRRRVLGENHPDTLFSMYSLAQVAARRGGHDQALDWLRQAVDRGLQIGDEMAGDSNLRSLKGNPAFDALVTRARQNTASRR